MPENLEVKDTKEKIIDLFGSKAFNLTVMRKRLPKHIYNAMLKVMKEDVPLEAETAEVVANAMKDWALEQGATHYTHWFQPLTGVTAEKHDAFINPTDEGKVIMEFSGKELVKGEPDASSFPSGGLRATFEARGYTAWDPSSFAFIKGTTLYIPTTFISYTGEVLDKKTPLLRSMKAISDEAKKTLKFFGKDDVKKVTTTVGAEQEYFLVERDMYKKRKDLILTGRTLFGAKPPKGQELDDHYFGRIRGRVANYMRDLDNSLWELGIPSKTKHNEVAPAQHELAPVFSTSNQAVDNNQLIMELMKAAAYRANLYCLLHEKPFEGVNGSGKHNNWAISTDTGENLLNPGKDPANNLQFMTFLTAVLEAVDRYPELLRVNVSSAGNDHRLGANEAPPAIVSVFLGEQLDEAVKAILYDKDTKEEEADQVDVGVDIVPNFEKDVTDRNRTSPFAFTGNKFELRMLGSNQSIADPNITLNTIVAEVLKEYNAEMEKFDPEHFDEELREMLKKHLRDHQRIIFNGDNYNPEWVIEAEKRGLPNLKTTPDALKELVSPKNIAVFENNNILSSTEMKARQEVYFEDYAKTINIEAQTMISMANHEILPACLSYIKDITETLANKKAIGIDVNTGAEEKLLKKASDLVSELSDKIDELKEVAEEAKDVNVGYDQAKFYQEKVIPAMEALRKPADELETIVGQNYWPYPIYEDLLFYV